MNLLFFLGLALANPASLLETANDHYLAGEYVEAAQGYGTLIQTGHTSGDLYYNLGNALYREGELAQAVLAWKRAEWLLPRDGDILANLDRARGQALDGIATDSGPRIYFLSRMLSVGEQAWASAWLLGLLGLLFVWRRARPVASLSIPVVLLGVPGALLLVSAAGELNRQGRQTPAVLVAPHVEATSAGEGGVALFELHAAAEVVILERVGDKRLISLPDGRRGWVPAEALGEVRPAAPMPG